MTKLQVLRKSKGLSQKEASMRLGICVAELSRLENGWVARIPDHLELSLKSVYGSEWTFELLMRPAVVFPDDLNAA